MEIVTIDGVNYSQRYVEFPFEITMSTGLEIKRDQKMAFPGDAPFLLKAVKRDVIAAGASVTRRFKFKFGNSDGGVSYTRMSPGGTTDRVIDSLIFGTGQFPKVFTPYMLFGRNSQMPMEFEDVSNSVPYTIYASFEGALLYPAGM